MLSYQDFAVRTLVEAPSHGNVVNVYNYAMNWAALRRLRSAWNVYNDGYYEDAASYLRSVLETTTYLSCVLKGYFEFQRIHDLEDDIDFDTFTADQFIKATRGHIGKLSKEIWAKVYGPSSGLSESERKEIKGFLWVHHSHVHRSESSVTQEVLKMIESRRLPPVTPEVDLDRASIFCNSAVFTSWTHVRVLPYLSGPSQYSERWQQLHRVLDEAFRYYIEAWEKPMKSAFLALIKTSFTFDESIALRQVLADSTG